MWEEDEKRNKTEPDESSLMWKAKGPFPICLAHKLLSLQGYRFHHSSIDLRLQIVLLQIAAVFKGSGEPILILLTLPWAIAYLSFLFILNLEMKNYSLFSKIAVSLIIYKDGTYFFLV